MAKDSPATQTATPPPLPAVYSREDDISASDLSMRKVYLLQDRSALVRARLAAPGEVVMAHDSDDTGFDYLIGGGRESYLAFILDRQRVVARIEGSDFEYLPNDYVRDPSERDVWVGYNYLISVPEVDEYLPVKQMFIKTSGQRVYQKINTYLQKAKGLGLTDPLAVEFTVTTKVGKGGDEYFALVPKEITDPPPGQLAIAKNLVAQGARLEQYGSQADTTPVETSDM